MERWKLLSYLIPLSVLLISGLTCSTSATKRNITTTPNKEQVKTFSPKTIRLTVDYEGDLKKDLEDPYLEVSGFLAILPKIYRVAEKMLEETGFIQVVGPGTFGTCDARLDIKTQGNALIPMGYLGQVRVIGHSLPSGAIIKGKISFTGRGREHTTKFGGPEFWPSHGSSNHAPFLEAWCYVSFDFIISLADNFFESVIPSLWGTEKMKPLIASLEHPFWYFRLRAVKSLRKIKDPGAVEPLIKILKGDVDENRSHLFLVGTGLYDSVPDPKLLKLLHPVLEPKETEVRKEAAITLGELKYPRAIEPLIAALNDKDEGLRNEARKALKKITREDLGNDPIQWQGWWEKNKSKYQGP